MTYPKTVVVISVVLTLIALTFVPRLHVSTDRNLLAGKSSKEFQRREEVSKMFGTSLISVVVVEADSQKTANATASQLAARLRKHPTVIRDVFFKADLAFFEKRGLLFAPEQTVIHVVDALNSQTVDLSVLEKGKNLSRLVMSGAEYLENQSVDEAKDPAEVEAGLAQIEGIFTSVIQWFTQPEAEELAIVSKLLQAIQKKLSLPVASSVDGFLTAKDADAPYLAVLFIQPAENSQAMEVVAPLTDLIRKNAKAVSSTTGADIFVTGMPSLATDELRLVTRDCIVAGAAAGLGVILVFMLAFRSLRVSIFLVLPLGVGLIWAAGFTGAVYQHLTMITSYFAAVLFGLGVAFTIHIVARFHEALLADHDVAVALETALIGAGPGVVIGGATTALAFLAIVFSEFQGFAEMGVISGVGVTMILVANLTLLPAALLLWHPGRKVVRVPVQATLGATLASSKKIVPLVGGLLFIAGIVAAFGVRFDYAVESMLPGKSEAVKGIRRLNERTVFSSTFSVATASSVDDAKRLARKFEKLPTVSRVESAALFVAENQTQKITALRKVHPDVVEQLRRLDAAWTKSAYAPTSSVKTLAAALEELQFTLTDLAFDAKRANRNEAASLERLAQTVQRSYKAVKKSNDARVAQLEQKVFHLLARGIGALAAGTTAKKFGVDDLPQTIRDRYVSGDGNHFAVVVYPNGDIGDKTFFYRHVDELLTVDNNITGHPVTHKRFTLMVQRGFVQAVLLSLLAVVVLVLLDLRNIRGLLLALGPVFFSAGLTALAMYIFDFELNYANLMALPILIGTGVDYGVHLAHRVEQEGDVFKAVNTTGRAIFLSGLTTLIGFGSLILGNHWGVKSLGILLVIGIFFALIAAMIVFPGLLAASKKE